MIFNQYEESSLKCAMLPISWQSESVQEDLEDFLQQNWNQRVVFYDDDRYESKQQFLSFTAHRGIRTRNYIGTISFAGEQLNIFPKVFREDKDDHDTACLSQEHLMRNIINWLKYCNKISYPFIHISAELDDVQDLRELFITLYLGYVRFALGRGLYYHYVDETEDVGFIKGKFDYKDYILKKIPNGMSCKFRCTYSKFEFDNRINQVIKFICKQLLNSTTKKNQAIIHNILTRLNDVSDVLCKPSDCDGLILSKMQSNYRVIMNMSRMFMLNKTSGFVMGKDESFCFLFPTELLFEGFVGGFLQNEIEELNGKVSLQKSDMHLIEDIQYADKSLGSAFAMRHDILLELEDRVFILDTKYKAVSRFEGDDETVRRIVCKELKQTDIYQVCEYARKRGVSDVFLLYPMYRYEEPEHSYPIGKSLSPNGNINIHFIRLPYIFEEDEENMKKQLCEVIRQIVDLR